MKDNEQKLPDHQLTDGYLAQKFAAPATREEIERVIKGLPIREDFVYKGDPIPVYRYEDAVNAKRIETPNGFRTETRPVNAHQFPPDNVPTLKGEVVRHQPESVLRALGIITDEPLTLDKMMKGKITVR